MYGWLLESIQHFVVQEFGEELWTLILQEAGSKNFVFNARQQYPDALMLRLSHALANRVANENASAATCSFKKSSLKSKPSWRSASVHADARTSFKCPFTSANALTAVTKKEIDAYNSLEEIRARTLSNDNFPTVSFNSGDKCKANVNKTEAARVNQDIREDNDENKEQYKEDEINNEVFNNDMSGMVKTFRKTSITLALDIYRRKPSYTPVKHRIIKMKPPLPTIQFGQKTILKDQFDTPDKVMHFFGRCFVKFFTNYGYDTMIRATGRYFCTFLQSVDSIHQRMRFTFPRMRSPSMQLTRAHQHGAELVYSSGRTGFTHYLMGQLYEIAEDIFNLKLRVSVVKESMEGSYYVAVLRLEFDNTDYVQSLMLRKTLPCPLAPVPASLLLQLFPFGVMLDRKMQVVMAGEKLIETWGGPSNRINKSPVSDILRLRKPKISFTWDKVICMQNMMFELELMRLRCEFRRGSQGCKAILLRGPIHLLEEIDALMFLCSPIFNNLEELSLADLCLADLNGHGLSKEMLLEGWQHVSRLEMLFDKAENRSLSLEKSCRLLDQWKKRGDHLLYSMIPKGVADHLRDGKDPLAACQAFDCVTVMFCGMQLQEAGTRADVLQTVAEINDVYSKIDRLLDSHKVYKVETVGTVYMVVSGAPERRRAHAASAASAALAVIRALPRLTIGVHSGPCVAGVLGRRLPRYCLVGDTVNTASRMQTTSEPGKIQISTEAAERLPAGRFRLRRRGAIKVKGKGMMETFWLEGEIEEDEQGEALHLFSTLCGD